ncbi:MAG: hypothetical protein ACRBB3_08105 [Alphaproteobacteria bacterium]
MSDFKINELDAGDGVPFNGSNPDDQMDKDNLLEVGLSEQLAEALDGKTIGEFQEIVTNTIESGNDVNLEMFEFAKEVFASYNDTGYENNAANAVLTGLENKLMDAWPTKEVQGLAFQYDGDMGPIAGKDGSPELPSALQTEEQDNTQGTGYFGTVTPTDIAMNNI